MEDSKRHLAFRSKDVAKEQQSHGAPPITSHHNLNQQISKQNKQQNKNNKPQKMRAIVIERGNRVEKARPVVSHRTATVSRNVSAGYRMTKCGAEYFRAVHDPFSLKVMPCVPSLIPLPSHKISVLTRGDFQVGSNGNGGVAFWPYRMLSKTLAPLTTADLTVVTPAVVTSQPGIPYADYPFLNDSSFNPAVSLDRVGYPGQTSLFNYPDFLNTSRQAKLVGAGIRVYYEDKAFERKGSFIVWRNNQALPSRTINNDGITELLNNGTAAKLQIADSRAVSVSYMPQIETDLQTTFSNSATSWIPNNSNSVANRLACAILVSKAGADTTYAFEAVAYFEVYGDNLPLTASHSDVIAVSQALGAGTAVPMNPSTEQSYVAAISNLITRDNVNQGASDYTQLMGGALRAGVSAALPALKSKLRKKAYEKAYGWVRKGVQQALAPGQAMYQIQNQVRQA